MGRKESKQTNKQNLQPLDLNRNSNFMLKIELRHISNIQKDVTYEGHPIKNETFFIIGNLCVYLVEIHHTNSITSKQFRNINNMPVIDQLP